MSEVLKSPAQVAAAAPKLDANWRSIRLYLPFLIPTVGALALTLLRIQMGGANFINDGALMMLALAGYKFRLTSFEKVADAHVLAVQKDPGATVFYIGSALLCLTLSAVFFFSHQRFWAIVEEREGGTFEVAVGGDANRNQVALEDRFKRLKSAITGEPIEVES